MIRRTALVLSLLALAGGAQAQDKKLYCWDDAGGNRICGDTLPPGATDLARTEIDARSGRAEAEVARALTGEERAEARVAADAAAAKAVADAARERRDLAMVESYASEEGLRRAYGERIVLVDEGIKASLLGEAALRRSLVTLLDQANALELAGKRVPAKLLDGLRARHAELQKQQRVLDSQQVERAMLGRELEDAVSRYRALKNPDDAAEVAPPGQ
jgi:hypothetical protein